MKKILTKNLKALFVLLLFVPAISKAQPFVDLLNIKTQFAPATAYVDDSKNKLSIRQYEGTLLLPIQQKNSDVILFGGDFTNLNLVTSGGINTTANLYSTSLLLGYEHQWKPKGKWRTLFITIPKINSSYKDLSGKDYQMGGIVMFKYQQSDDLKWHFGGYYNKEYFGNLVIPLVGIDWKINDKLNLFGDMPISLTLEYKMAKSLYVGTAFYSTIASFRPSGSNGDTYVRQGNGLEGDNQIKAFINYYVTKYVVIYAEGGQSFGRMFPMFNSSTNMMLNTNPVFQPSMDGLFFNVGLAFRIRT